jgi:peptidoglycan/xylan/chitin deacetylase (PgdA/CDA1 family)
MLTVAAPLLECLKIPAVLYLPTRLIARGESPWADVVYSAFRYRTKHTLHLPALRQAPYALQRLDERRAAYQELTEKLIETNLATRRSLLEQALDALAPWETPPPLLLNWTDVRELRRRHPWFRLGAHGAEHLDMTSQTDDTLDDELEGCRREFETELGEPALHFAYPYSRSSERTRRAFDRHPFATAMTNGDSGCLVDTTTDSLAIPRLDAPEDLALLGHFTSGAYPRLSQKVFGRS